MRHACWIFGVLVLLAAPAALAGTGDTGPDKVAEARTGNSVVPKAPDITPETAASIQAMCEVLKSRPAFSFAAELSGEHVYPNGQNIQLTRYIEVTVKRPDKIYSRVTGDERDRIFVYDGKTVTVADLDRGVYAVVDAPATIDATIAMLSTKYGIDAPLSDLLTADPCADMLEQVRTGDYVGSHLAAGKMCDHLAFSQKDSDWQLWVERGKVSLPRKLVINDKNIMGWPQFSATFTDWNLNPRLPAGFFTFVPRKDLRRVDFMPLASGQGEAK
jgi:hypothetical protein